MEEEEEEEDKSERSALSRSAQSAHSNEGTATPTRHPPNNVAHGVCDLTWAP